jgi:hypothetical protein
LLLQGTRRSVSCFIPDAIGGAPLSSKVSCDMKLHSVLLGWRNPDQALRVSAGTPRKHASDGLSCSRGYCQGYEAFPVM